jgi:hypothetical protein
MRTPSQPAAIQSGDSHFHPMRNDDMSANGAPIPVPLSQSGKSLKIVLDMLLQDMTLNPVDPATLPWDRPIFILRSANMGRMRALIDQVIVRAVAPQLHIMSHARDEQALRELVPCHFTFHGYPTPGRYRLEEISPSTLDRLRAVDFGVLFCLDPGLSAELLDEVDRVLVAIGPTSGISFGSDGQYSRLPERRGRQRAECAFYGLIEWYQSTVDPVSAE